MKVVRVFYLVAWHTEHDDKVIVSIGETRPYNLRTFENASPKSVSLKESKRNCTLRVITTIAGSSPAVTSMIDIYKVINKICEQKREAQIIPCFAIYSEIMNEVSRQVKQEINDLVSDKKLTFHRTLNNVSFEIIQTKQNKKNG